MFQFYFKVINSLMLTFIFKVFHPLCVHGGVQCAVRSGVREASAVPSAWVCGEVCCAIRSGIRLVVRFVRPIRAIRLADGGLPRG